MEIILYPPSSPIAFTLCGYCVRWYGIIISAAFFVGIIFCYKIFLKKTGSIQAENFLNFSPVIILFSIIGARVFYIFGSLEFYKNNPKEMFFLNHGGLSIWGAIIFGFISILYYCKKNNFSLLKYCDIISLAMPLCQAIGRWGNFFNQEAYGLPYNGFLKLYVTKSARIDNFQNINFYHPAFLWESILNLFLFLILYLLFRKKKYLKDGTIFFLYLIFYSIIRILIESIRIDSVLNFGFLHIAQIIALIVLFISFLSLLILYIGADKP